jgi:hypothetical protein
METVERTEAVPQELPKETPAITETPRDGAGRFSKILSSWKEDAQYREAVLGGAVAPSDEMDADTWRAARLAQIEHGTSKITAPEAEGKPEGEKIEAAKPSGDEQKNDQQVEERPLPPEHEHWNRDKVARTWYRDFDATVNSVPFSVSPGTGLAIAELPNSADVLYALSKNHELLAALDTLPPNRRVGELAKISNIIAYGTPTAPKDAHEQSAPKAAEKYAPIEPVGARAPARAFDVNDESLSPSEWRKKRDEQIRKQEQR